uniref:Myotubularin phosphatase domain-containing protein n=1 Tax=Clastoptera arizonana TaxID=38151 RepID=A0A1B6CPY7_9HEMI
MEFFEYIPTPKLDNVIMTGPFKKTVEGTLNISGHHLLLSSRKENNEELWLLHYYIDVVERKINSNMGGTLIIKCKDFRIIQLEICPLEEFNKIATSVEILSSLDNQTQLYPFFYRPMYPILEDGWTVFRPETEFRKLVKNEDWRITYINNEFQVCPTYPNALIVPKSIDDESILAAAKFREGGRFPVLSYLHESGCVLMRSSQPLTGPNSKRCKEDERLINSVLGPGKRGYIIDTRTQAIAQTAKSRGGGFEVEIHYPQWRRLHKPIERYPALLDSLTKLIEACSDSTMYMDKWLSRLDASTWMTHIKDTLDCACLVAQCLDKEGASVLVHGNESLDATLLVTSLAQIILNPDCRTVRGIQALIEREWLQAGHPFPRRVSHSVYASATANGRTKQNAPTFLLFLDCVMQIMNQFSFSFEFTTNLLIFLFEHSYCSSFGTFLGNCEAERVKLKLATRTASLWSYINRPEILPAYLNPVYEPNNSVIWPSVAPVSLVLWQEVYLRWVVDQTEQKNALDKITTIKEKDKELRLKAIRLQRQLTEMEKELKLVTIVPAVN